MPPGVMLNTLQSAPLASRPLQLDIAILDTHTCAPTRQCTDGHPPTATHACESSPYTHTQHQVSTVVSLRRRRRVWSPTTVDGPCWCPSGPVEARHGPRQCVLSDGTTLPGTVQAVVMTSHVCDDTHKLHLSLSARATHDGKVPGSHAACFGHCQARVADTTRSIMDVQ